MRINSAIGFVLIIYGLSYTKLHYFTSLNLADKLVALLFNFEISKFD